MRMRTTNSLADLNVIREVAHAKNFSAAARELGLPPSSVSRRIAAVEQRLGVPLFHRTTREVSLTDAGAAYCAHIERILAEMEEAEMQVSRLAGLAQGTLLIETRPGISAWLLAPLLPRFLEAYPTISIDLRLTNDPIESLSPGTDLALRYGLAPPSSLVTRKITSTRQKVYASPEYIAKHGMPKTPEELANHNCIGFTNGNRPVVWRFRRQGYDRAIHVQGNLRGNDASALRTGVLAGVGVGISHVWIMRQALEERRVVELLDDYEPSTTESYEMNVSALYSPTMKNVEKLRVFLEFLQSNLKGNV